MAILNPRESHHNMSEQTWRRRPAACAPSRATLAASKSPSSASRPVTVRPRGADCVSSAMSPTTASNGKKIASKKPPAAESEASRWRALRQSVHVRATVNASARPTQSARIADLCEQDRDKVAQLIRRVVEIGTIHEESEAAFTRERAVLRSEIDHLRTQAKRDAAEIDELGDKLRSTLLSLRGHQERVLALEQSSETETRARHETEQTVDMLRAEVEKLRLLVRRQRDEMETERRREQERFQAELREVREELRAAQSQLIQKREERIAEKQWELDARLLEQAEREEQARDNHSEGPKAKSEEKLLGPTDQPTALGGAVSRDVPASALDISSFLNTSVELPETIRAIMNDWKERMEEALSGVASAATAPIVPRSGRKSPASSSGGDTSPANSSAARETAPVRHQAPSNAAMRSEGAPETRESADRAHSPVNEDNGPSEGADSEYEASLSDQGDRKRVRVIKRLNFDACSSSADESSRSGSSDESHHNITARNSRKVSHLRKNRRPKRHEQIVQARATKSSGRRSSRHHHRHQQPAVVTNGARQVAASTPQRRGSHSVSNSDEDWISGSESESRQQQLRGERRRSRGAKAEVAEENRFHDRSMKIRQPPPDSSFGSLYETSLFEVVDAIESVRARDEDTQPRSQGYNHGLTKYTPVVVTIPHNVAENDSRARVERLKEHIKARERKLAARNGVQEPPRSTSPGWSGTQGGGDRHDVDDAASMDDFEVFNAVKDLYSREVFANSHPSGDRSLPTWKAKLSNGDDGGFVDDDGIYSWQAYNSGVSRPMAGVPIPPHGTPQEIREAVEDDIEALLRQEPLMHDLFLIG